MSRSHGERELNEIKKPSTNLVNRACRNCGNGFVTQARYVSRGAAKYCSRGCSRAGTRTARRERSSGAAYTSISVTAKRVLGIDDEDAEVLFTEDPEGVRYDWHEDDERYGGWPDPGTSDLDDGQPVYAVKGLDLGDVRLARRLTRAVQPEAPEKTLECDVCDNAEVINGEIKGLRSPKIVTVCGACLTESCLRTSLKCAESRAAGTITDTEERIAALTSTETDLKKKGVEA